MRTVEATATAAAKPSMIRDGTLTFSLFSSSLAETEGLVVLAGVDFAFGAIETGFVTGFDGAEVVGFAGGVATGFGGGVAVTGLEGALNAGAGCAGLGASSLASSSKVMSG